VRKVHRHDVAGAQQLSVDLEELALAGGARGREVLGAPQQVVELIGLQVDAVLVHPTADEYGQRYNRDVVPTRQRRQQVTCRVGDHVDTPLRLLQDQETPLPQVGNSCQHIEVGQGHRIDERCEGARTLHMGQHLLLCGCELDGEEVVIHLQLEPRAQRRQQAVHLVKPEALFHRPTHHGGRTLLDGALDRNRFDCDDEAPAAEGTDPAECLGAAHSTPVGVDHVSIP